MHCTLHCLVRHFYLRMLVLLMVLVMTSMEWAPSGSTLDDKLGAVLSKFVHFEAQIAQIPALTTWMSRSIKCFRFGKILAYTRTR